MEGSRTHRPVDFTVAHDVANAVLYEGYLLYPYRSSALKNRMRFQFGVVAPKSWVEANVVSQECVAGSAEGYWSETQCLLDASRDATFSCQVRYLALSPARPRDDSSSGPTPALDSATPQSVEFSFTLEGALATPLQFPIGTVGLATASAQQAEAAFPLWRVTVRVENVDETEDTSMGRDEALRHSLVATHVLIAASEGAFLSLVDPPAWAHAAALTCRNVRTFPVLVGPEDEDRLILSSPILLPDRPEVAPESPGDLFDAAEIDEILSLRMMTLTDAEKADVRATDPLAAGLLERVETMPAEVFERLHGALRGLRAPHALTARTEPPAWWEPGGDRAISPLRDQVVVFGVPVSRGSIVRVHPHGRADALDTFLEGRAGTVTAVLTDVDGNQFVAVALDETIEDAERYLRSFQFRPDEIEPVPDDQFAQGSHGRH